MAVCASTNVHDVVPARHGDPWMYDEGLHEDVMAYVLASFHGAALKTRTEHRYSRNCPRDAIPCKWLERMT